MRKIQWRAGSLFMVIVLLLSLIPMNVPVKVQAAGDEWTEIRDKAGLLSISANLSGNYRLMADIDLAGVEWTPLGTFTGKLDGNSKVIRNFTINDTSTSNKGLFSSVSGQISHLGIEGAGITGGDYTGILAGTNSGSISRCYAKGSVSGNEYVGGLVGKNEGQISDCFTVAVVSGKERIGGLVGSNSGVLSKSYSSSQVNASVFNNCLQFDGVDDYIEIPHNDEYVGNAFTLEAWFQWDKTNTSEVNFIVGKGYEQFEIHTGGDSGVNGIRFIPIPSNYGDSYLDVSNVIQPGWFHVAVVYEYDTDLQEASAQLYINGKAAGSKITMSRATNPLSANTAPVYIGRRSDDLWPYYFSGKISDVRFWNVARTAEEIAANKDKQLLGSEIGLVGYWKLTEATGTTAIDSTSFANNGTLKNGITRVQEEAATFIGGLCGENTVTGTTPSNFFDGTVAGVSANNGIGHVKTTGEMNLSTTYTATPFDWDFTAVWGQALEINDGYPYLLSTAKDISSFQFSALSPEVAGVIDETAGTINLTVPSGTVVTALTPTIVHTGVNISPTTAQDFSSPVTYTVTAEDGSTKYYMVSVDTVMSPVITTQPAGIAIDSGGMATFRIVATASAGGSLSYQWQKSTDTGTTWSDIIGATGTEYTTGTLAFADTGSRYRCVVTNTKSGTQQSTMSEAAILLVTDAGGIVNLASYNTAGATIYIPAGTTATVRGTESVIYSDMRIFCGAGVSVTLDNVTITNTTSEYSPITFTGEGNTLTVTGSNKLKGGGNRLVAGAAAVTTVDAALNINGTGTLSATGGSGNTVGGAGIGGSTNQSGGSITISGGNITATGGTGNAYKRLVGQGICAEKIEIKGGAVTATGKAFGSGIGGSFNDAGSSVTILGGTVTATGGGAAPGIGGYVNYLGDTVTPANIAISGGRVIATGISAPGVGGTDENLAGGSILLTGGELFANRMVSDDSINDIGRSTIGGTWTVTIGGTAKVFLKNDKAGDITTATHSHETYAADTVSTVTGDYGVVLPDGWLVPFGAWLSHPTLSYDENGGSKSAPASIAKLAGTGMTVASASGITHANCTFTGWNTAADGTGTTYQSGDTLTLDNADITLYAQWVINEAGISNLTAPATGAEPITLGSLIAGYDGYIVTGLSWKDSDGTTPATLIDGKFKAGAVYKAVIELTAKEDTRFQALTPTVNVGTAGAGTVNASMPANKLTFLVTFPATTTPTATAVSGTALTVQPIKIIYSDDANNDDSSSNPTSDSSQTNLETQITVQVTSPVTIDKDNNVTVIITEEVLNDIINSASQIADQLGVMENGIVAEVTVNTPTDADTLTVNLPKIIQDRLVAENIVEFKINSSNIEIGIDEEALHTIWETTGMDAQIIAMPITVSDLSSNARVAIGSHPVYELTLAYGDKRLTDFGNGKVHIGIPYTLGINEQVGNIAVVYVNEQGKIQWLTNSAYDISRRMVIFTTDHFSTYGVSYQTNASAFSDIKGHWAKDDILFAVNRGLLTATGTGKFSPDTAITRGEFITALNQLLESEGNAYGIDSFGNTAVEKYYRPEIEWIYEKDIASNLFSSEKAITREEIALILYCYASATDFTLPALRETISFADSSDIGKNYSDAVKALQQAGIIVGEQNNIFNPKGNVTRAELAALLYRYIKLTIDPATAQGWAKNDDGQMFFYKEGKLLTGWQTIEGKKYFFSPTGVMQTGWKKDEQGNKFYLTEDGSTATGWYRIGGKRYYFKKNGIMLKKGWKQLGGKWYYFYKDGSIAINTKINGYEVDKNGVRKAK